MNEQHLYTWLDQEQVTTPQHHTVSVIRDNWWIVNSKGQVALFQGTSPQCNTDRAIAEKVGQQTCEAYAGVVQLPLAFLEHRCWDYR